MRFGYRDYDPDSGRWTAKDPLNVASGDLYLYEYCGGDPVNYIDPFGLESIFTSWIPTNFLYQASNFVAGVGDTISMDLTRKFRQWQMGQDVVDTTSAAYKIGIGVGTGIELLGGDMTGIAKLGGKMLLKGASKGVIKKTICTVTRGKIPGFCFVAGTEVAVEDGTKPIEALDVGDKVWAYDETTGEIGLHDVIQTFENETDAIVVLNVDGEEIRATQGHPFYVTGQGWTKAVDLSPGDVVSTMDTTDNDATVDSVEVVPEAAPVYNIEVAGAHTYFVSDEEVLVHNTCAPIPTEGVYAFPSASGLPYVGQSSDIPRRLMEHLASGKLPRAALNRVRTLAVSGGRTAREVMEQRVINGLGGIGVLDNIRNSIGAARSHLMNLF